MSRDLTAEINKPVTFDRMHHDGLQIMQQLLQQDGSLIIPEVNIVMNRTYEQGRMIEEGQLMEPNAWHSIVFGGNDSSTKNTKSLLKKLFPSSKPQKSVLVEIINTDHKVRVECLEVQSGILFSSSSDPSSVVWAVCLGLAAAKIGEGKFINYEFWPNANFPSSPDEFIDMSKQLSMREAASFNDACQFFLDVLNRKAQESTLR